MRIGRHGTPGALPFLIAALAALAATSPGAARDPLRFSVRFGPEASAVPLDGRLLVLVSTDETGEPRFQLSDGPRTQQAFGVDVDGLRPGQAAIVDEATLGYPLERMADVPAGTYVVQALLHRYETFLRSWTVS